MNSKETKEEILSKSKIIEMDKLALEYFEAKDEEEKWSNNLKAKRNLILEFLRKNSLKSYEFTCDVKDEINNFKSEVTSFILCNRNNITYDMDKLKKVLTKNEQRSLISKTYIITDWDKLVKIMKKYDVPAKEVKDCLICNESVDTNKMQQMYDVGDFDINKIKNAYSITTSQYLAVKSKKVK